MQMQTMEMEGYHAALGQVYLRLNTNQVTLGQIEEQSNIAAGVLDVPPFGPADSLADSFFDVYFEVEIPGQPLLHNERPARMEGTITNKPPGPGDEYIKHFALHEGTKVAVQRQSGEWCLVRLPNGLGGWIRADAMERI